MSQKALIAMSGGVDSSVAAYLMKTRGFDCAGATMKLFGNGDIGLGGDDVCCSLESAEDARSVADSLGLPFYVFNFAPDFKKQVVGRFVRAYQKGETPNPCVDCNRYIKFDKLLRRAKELDMDYLVTGHYARIERDARTGKYLLKKAADETKDQSYVLYALTQEQLSHILFPLGAYTKAEIRALAAAQGFVNADKRDSQDICFAPDGDYAGFIERRAGAPAEPGDFVDARGGVLGRHKGLIRYTIGQRKGLGIAFKTPLYVLSKDTAANTVTLGGDGELYTKTLEASEFNWIAGDKPDAPVRVKAKVRYKHAEQWATAEQVGEDRVRVVFDEPQRAIAKGQAAVLYDGDTVVGGGTIL
ncbi:MAG: tRNA 2-thiouridine(34) synthase MnmA [Oscillospiraceae bacterium]|nr:tRNA 2-thiouridine(34) synthase MnmA [Oscillospiraceae bacterium]